MNFRSAKSACFGLQTVAAILLLQVNLAFAAEPPQAQPAPQTPQTQAAPEAPVPAANGPAAPPTLAQQMQQARIAAIAPQQPFNVPMPRSYNPLARYRASTAPPLNLSNSSRLENLIRNGKIYLSLNDAIALAIENNLDLAYFRY